MFKKIASVLASTVMIGSTIAFATAAYPVPFVESGAANAAVVYGSGAASTDIAAAVGLKDSLDEGVTATVTTATGDEVAQLDKTNDKINLLDTVSGTFGTTVDDEDLSVLLADGSYAADDSDTFDYEQKITLSGPAALAHFRDSTYEDQAGLDDRTPVVGFNLSSSNFVMNYTLDFLDQAESDIASSDLEDIEGSDLPLLGKTYYVSDFKNGTNANTFGKLTLLDSASTSIVEEGTSVNLIVDGKPYEVSINFIDNDEVKLMINGVATDKLTAGQTEKLADGSYVGIREVSKLEVSGETGNVEFSIGRGKLEITSGSEVELNDENVDGVIGYAFRGTPSGDAEKIDKIVIEWTTKDEEFLTPSSALTLPGFEAIQFTMNDLVRSEEEEITVQADGDDSIELIAPIADGDATINILYANASGEFTGIGKASDERLATSATNELIYYEKQNSENYHEYFVATYNVSDVGESYLLSMSVNEDTSDGRNETTIRNEITGESWSERVAGDEFDIGDVSFTINSIDKNSSDEWVNITGGTNVNFNTIITDGGLKIWLPTDVNGSTVNGGIDFDDAQIGHSAGHDLNTWYLYMDGEDKDDNLAAGTEFYFTIDDNSDGELEVSQLDGSGTGGSNGLQIGDSKNYEAYIVDAAAPRVMHYTAGDQDYAKVYYPTGDSETYAEVFIGAVGAASAAGGVLAITDGEVASNSDKNLIIVGGTCINKAAAMQLTGSEDAVCGDAFTALTNVGAGQYLIEVAASKWNAEAIAMVVAGYEAADTEAAVDKVMEGSVSTDVGTSMVGPVLA
jgi:hypothetical protein